MANSEKFTSTTVVLSDFSANSAIDNQVFAIDNLNSISINQTTAGVSLTLGIPANPRGRNVTVIVRNVGTADVMVEGALIAVGKAVVYSYSGTAWLSVGAPSNDYRKAPVSTLAGLPTPSAALANQQYDVSDGDRAPRTCRETSAGVYEWIDENFGRINTNRFGTGISNGTIDITDFLQAAINAAEAHSNINIVGTASGQESLGGGIVVLPPSPSGYRISKTVNVTKTKIKIIGPARIYIDAGVTAFAFNFAGSSDKTGVLFENIDFTGGVIAVDVGQNTVPAPVRFYNCRFINQTTSSIKIGDFGFSGTIQQCLFEGNTRCIWMNGDAADGWLIEQNVFIYNNDTEIVIDKANVVMIKNNIFTGNLNATNQRHIHILNSGLAEVGSYSQIVGNKFGAEGRTLGNIIELGGSGPSLIKGIVIKDNLLHFESSVNGTGKAAIKVNASQLSGITVRNNSIAFCRLFDSAGELTSGYSQDMDIGINFFEGSEVPGVNRGGFFYTDKPEPEPENKINLAAWSRYVNDGGNFTYNLVTPSYMTAIDENGIPNNATTCLATGVNNFIRLNQVNTNNTQKWYTVSVWVKMDVKSDVSFSSSRGANYAFNKTLSIDTTWQRVTFEFYQTYFTTGNPYVFDITIPTGRTITLGGLTIVAGRDVGDLRKTPKLTEKHGIGFFGTGVPADIYHTAGTIVWNAAPVSGNIKGWVCTVSGVPGTWVAFYDTPQALSIVSNVQFGGVKIGAASPTLTYASHGTGTLAAGTVTILNINVAATSHILLTRTSAGTGVLAVTAKTVSTSFTVTSSDGADTGTFDYWIVN